MVLMFLSTFEAEKLLDSKPYALSFSFFKHYNVQDVGLAWPYIQHLNQLARYTVYLFSALMFD